jgi:transposase
MGTPLLRERSVKEAHFELENAFIRTVFPQCSIAHIRTPALSRYGVHNHSSSFAKGEGNPVMQATVTPQQRQAAKREIVRQMKQGASSHEARVRSTVPMHRTTVYRLLKRVQHEGEQALVERRHGHPVKLRGEVLTWLMDYCQNHRSASSSAVQRFLSERFGFSVSVSQLNRVRAAHGLSRMPVPREKKGHNRLRDCIRLS